MSTPLSNISHRFPKQYSQQLDSLVGIYRFLYPHSNLRFILHSSDNAISSPPHVYQGYSSILASDFDHTFLGVLDLTNSNTSTFVTIRARLPILKTTTNASISPRRSFSRAVEFVIQKSPVSYEFLKYQIDLYNRARSHKRHRWTSIHIDRNLPLYCNPVEDNASPSIIIAMHWIHYGGAEKFALECIEAALMLGIRVFVVSDTQHADYTMHLLPNSELLQFIEIDKYLPAHLWPQYIAKLIKQENVQLVHIHHCRMMYDCLPNICALNPEITTVDTTHIIEFQDGGYPRISGVWSNFIDFHHVISKELAHFYKSRFGINDRVVLGRLLPSGRIDADKLRLHHGQSKIHVLFVGRMVHQKRPILFIEIARKLHTLSQSCQFEFRFDIVGDGDYRPIIEDSVQRYKLEDVVELHAPDSSVSDLMKRADILIMPSANEGLALTCYEAMLGGVLPISTGVGAQGEIIPDPLIVSVEPRKCVNQTISIVFKLITNRFFLENCKYLIEEKFSDISLESRGIDIITDLYIESIGS